jgi:hypothetical protein
VRTATVGSKRKTKAEIIRCLKRYVVRERFLTSAHTWPLWPLPLDHYTNIPGRFSHFDSPGVHRPDRGRDSWAEFRLSGVSRIRIPARDHRRIQSGVPWILSTRAPRRDLPDSYGRGVRPTAVFANGPPQEYGRQYSPHCSVTLISAVHRSGCVADSIFGRAEVVERITESFGLPGPSAREFRRSRPATSTRSASLPVSSLARAPWSRSACRRRSSSPSTVRSTYRLRDLSEGRLSVDGDGARHHPMPPLPASYHGAQRLDRPDERWLPLGTSPERSTCSTPELPEQPPTLLSLNTLPNWPLPYCPQYIGPVDYGVSSGFGSAMRGLPRYQLATIRHGRCREVRNGASARGPR